MLGRAIDRSPIIQNLGGMFHISSVFPVTKKPGARPKTLAEEKRRAPHGEETPAALTYVLFGFSALRRLITQQR